MALMLAAAVGIYVYTSEEYTVAILMAIVIAIVGWAIFG